ncbi:MAG: hypothetical protein ACI9U5_002126 [Colwellia sp.]|jgi:hypothetical protein
MTNGQHIIIKHPLSLANINLLKVNVVEVIINKNIEVSLEISLEMSEGYDDFMTKNFYMTLLYLLIKSINITSHLQLNLASRRMII